MRRFNSYSLNEMIDLIENFNIERKITQIHIHHTWRPTKEQYSDANDKERIILGMYNYHTIDRGWADIGQHFTVSPDGLIWDGRSMEMNPASITGMNTGAIAIEMIGDFDIGREKLEGSQLRAVINLVSILLEKFNLTTNSIIFHNEGSTKTCPGTSIDKGWFINKVNEVSNVEHEEWKYEGIDYLYRHNLLNSPDMWKREINNPMPVWAVTLLLKRIHEDIMEIN